MNQKFEITDINAIEILDSRGDPTIGVYIKAGNFTSFAMVPSGASTGSHESIELRDGDYRFMGKGVRKAVDNVNNKISRKIIGMDCRQQSEIDNVMIDLDGTENKSNLGSNAMLGVSIAASKVASKVLNIQLYEYLAILSCNNNKFVLPVPQMNVINGGKHAGINNDIQEHMLIPIGAKSFSEAIRMCVETYKTIKKILKQKFGFIGVNVADEGGFVPSISSLNDRLELMVKAIEEIGYSDEIKIALDCAATEFYHDNKYDIRGKIMDSGEMIEFYKELVNKYPIVSIEDGFAEDDFNVFSDMMKSIGDKIQIVGDDLLVTNIKRIEKAIKLNSCNALLLKVNQIGTLTESINASNLALKNNWNVIVSHRSGDTEDTFIADLAVGIGANQVKFGAPARSERCSKYNRLLKIEHDLENDAIYAKYK